MAAAVLPAAAAIWPEQIWEHKRTSRASIDVSQREVWEEYGLEEAERASYEGPGGSIKTAAYRLKDPTSALGVYQWLHPGIGAPATLWKTGVQTANRAYLQVGNYILDFEGRIPTTDEFSKLYVQLPRLDQSAMPSLPNHFPKEGVIPSSRRYVIGPAGMAAFFPGVPPSVAAFSLAAEAQIGRFKTPAGDIPLAVVAYPTPQMAREKLGEYQRLPGALAKRSGPLVAIAMGASSADEAEKLLAKVNYQAVITWNEKAQSQEAGLAEFFLNVVMLIGALLGGTILAGALFAGAKIAYRRARGVTEEEDGVLRLELDK